MERYIEAEALKKVMCEGCDNIHLCAESPACETVQQIDSAPKVDVVSMGRYINAIKTINMMSKVLEEFAPVKHGRWDLVEGDCSTLARCSVCGRDVVGGISWDLKGNEYRYKYCPNCGARMDEVK